MKGGGCECAGIAVRDGAAQSCTGVAMQGRALLARAARAGANFLRGFIGVGGIDGIRPVATACERADHYVAALPAT